jgi:hypothetical protein
MVCRAVWLVGVSVREYREVEAGHAIPRLRDLGSDLQAVRVAEDFPPDGSRVNGMIPPTPTTADDWLNRWRAWLDLDAMPEGWNKNLWGKFYALMHRRRMYREYLAVLAASPNRAAQSAAFLTQWIARDHVETQAIAIRRIAHRTADQRTVSLVKLLDEIASNPSVLSPPVSAEA